MSQKQDYHQSIWEASADPSKLDLSGLENIFIKRVKVHCRVLDVKKRELTPGEISMFRSDEESIGYNIHFLPLELRVQSRRPIEIIHFDLSPAYPASPIQPGDDIIAHLWGYDQEYSPDAVDIDKKFGEQYTRIESYRQGFGNLRPLPLRPETLLKRLD